MRLALNVIGYLLYVGLVFAGGYAIWFSLFFGVATDDCHDAACEAGYHVWPAMLTMWIGVGTVLLVTFGAMIVGSIRSRTVAGWPFAGLAGLGIVFLVAKDLVLH